LMGAVNTASQQLRIEQENRFFDDIVQGSFQDAYRNLTYKHVMALKWHTYHCPHAPYVLKTDDDVFVNMPRLIGMLTRTVGTNTGGGRKELLWCSKVHHALVRRSFRSKWRVSASEFADKFYPDHCPGFVILYSSDVVRRLYTTAQVTPYFWVDDVHITGVVAGKQNITITSFKNYYVVNDEQQKRLVSGAARDEDLSFIIAQPNLSGKDIKELWKAVLPKNRDSR
jgi:Galactosyltransferase